MSQTQAITKWAIDPTHSEIQFKIKHLVISTVTGYFRSFEGSLEAAGDSFENASVNFTADIDSIDTNQKDRDAHLKSDDFFNAEQFPKLSFKSTAFTSKGNDTYEMLGDLTIRDNTKSVALHVEFGGQATDPYGNEKAGFEINGVISRKEFGLTWNGMTEAGGVVVSDEVKLHLNVQLNKQA